MVLVERARLHFWSIFTYHSLRSLLQELSDFLLEDLAAFIGHNLEHVLLQDLFAGTEHFAGDIGEVRAGDFHNFVQTFSRGCHRVRLRIVGHVVLEEHVTMQSHDALVMVWLRL